MSQSFEVTGGKHLKGDIFPQGAKNEALQIVSAVLLTAEEVTISNIPDIIDVNLLIELLHDMNVKVDRVDRHTCRFRADDVDINYFLSENYKKKMTDAEKMDADKFYIEEVEHAH